MRTYAIAITVVALLSIGLLLGANVQPILTGAGYLKFPENATPAYLFASNGQLKIAAGGTDQSILFAPTGTGYTLFQSGSVNGLGMRANGNPVFPGGSGPGVEMAVISSLAHVYGYDRTGFAGVSLSLENWGGRVMVGTATDDGANMLQVAGNSKFTGNVDLTGVYKKGGTSGASGTDTIGNVFSGGIVTTVGAGSAGFSSFSLTTIAVNTVYQNTSGHTQYVQVPASVTGAGSVGLAYCDSAASPVSVVSIFSDTVVGIQYGTLSFMVLPNYYWKIDAGTALYDSKARVWQ